MTVNKVLDLWSLTVSKETNIEILFVSLEGYHLNWRKSKHKIVFFCFEKIPVVKEFDNTESGFYIVKDQKPLHSNGCYDYCQLCNF